MRWWGLGLLIALAACEGGGVEIIVYPPAEAGAVAPDEIRLYVGLGAVDMTRLATRNFAAERQHRGAVWSTDGDVPFDSGTPASPTSPVRFTYAARGDGDTLSVIAVGMTGGQPTSAVARYDLVVPTAHVAVYTAGLNPAGAAKPGAHEINQIELWGPGTTDQTCAQLIDYRSDHDDPRYPISFVTTPGDEDCDGFPTGSADECDDHAYRAQITPGTSTLSCVAATPIQVPGDVVPACRFGGPICIDGNPAGHVDCSIDRRAYCAPQSLCERCLVPTIAKPFEGCAIDPLGSDPAGGGARFECTLPFTEDNGQITLCPAIAVLSAQYSTAQAVACASPMFHGSAPDARWITRVPVGTGSLSLGVIGTGSSCALTFATPTPPSSLDVTKLPLGGLVAVDLTATRGVVLPVTFALELQPRSSCTTSPATVQCHPTNFDSGDSLQTCLTDAPPNP